MTAGDVEGLRGCAVLLSISTDFTVPNRDRFIPKPSPANDDNSHKTTLPYIQPPTPASAKKLPACIKTSLPYKTLSTKTPRLSTSRPLNPSQTTPPSFDVRPPHPQATTPFPCQFAPAHSHKTTTSPTASHRTTLRARRPTRRPRPLPPPAHALLPPHSRPSHALVACHRTVP
ncbi:hypothetical protein EV421DRAFT_1908060 [Armillaria borealis]|uniref:Uncharacterized protein n=1 Tax=Armillaria borealis TaxID=47425 RepID=A0AA39J5C6_9AGAR|nr:hypothetical protein EV421DRAFT_1908060 [Armillaria borealis]